MQRLDSELEAALAVLRQKEVTLNGLPARNTAIVESRAPAPRAALAARARVPPQEEEELCPRGRAMLEMLESPEVAAALKAACGFVRGKATAGRDPLVDEALEHAHVTYKHALRRLKLAYPSSMFEALGSDSAEALVRLAHGLKAGGFPIVPADSLLDRGLEAAACVLDGECMCGDGPCACRARE